MRRERKTRIVTAVLCGDSYKEVADREHLSERRVREICASADLSPSRVKEIKQQAVAQAIGEGKTRAEVEEKFRVKLGFIQEACEKHGIAFEPFGLRSERTFQILRDFINTTLTLQEIAAKHGVSVATISDLYHKAIQSELPIQTRRHGSKSPRKSLRIAISFDSFLIEAPEVYRALIRNLENVAEIHFVASPSFGGEREVLARLHGLGFGYDHVHVTEGVTEFVNDGGFHAFFGADDDQICLIDPGITVFKIRDGTNFDFDDGLWVYDSLTGASTG